MSVSTPEALSDANAEDLIWRKKELTTLKYLLSTASSKRKAVLLRALVALLYAHWEGFIKNTSERYISYLSVRRLKYKYLTSNLVALSLRSRIGDASRQNNIASLIEVVDLLRGNLEERSRLREALPVDTKANLSSAVLVDLLTALGLDQRPFISKAPLIDQRLLASRNRIAHGDYLEITEESALELADEIQELMETYRNLIENAVVLKEYRSDAEQKGMSDR